MVMMTMMIMVRTCERRRRTYHNDKSPFQKDAPLVKTGSTDSGEMSARTAAPEGPDAVGQRFMERKRVLDSGCPQYLQQRGEIKRWFTGLYLSISHNVFYCPIEKTGSTEWRLLIRTVSNHGVTVKTIGSMSTAFVPLCQHCHVCDFPYTHVGHLETVPEDQEFLLNAMDSPVDYVKDYPIENLEAQVKWYIGDKEKYGECVTMDEALRRLWQKLKIRGYLYKDIRYPLTPQQSENVSVRAFVSVASKAMELSRKASADLKGNRRLSLIEAFQSVPDAQKRELQTLFRWDFELFGYDPYPPEVFKETVKSTSLFDLWK